MDTCFSSPTTYRCSLHGRSAPFATILAIAVVFVCFPFLFAFFVSYPLVCSTDDSGALSLIKRLLRAPTLSSLSTVDLLMLQDWVLAEGVC